MNPAPPVTNAVFTWVVTCLTRRSNPWPEASDNLDLDGDGGVPLRSRRQRGSRREKSHLPIGDIASSMLTGVGFVAVLVTDANKAAVWYRQRLGAEVTVQGHWVAAKLPRSSMVIHLCGKNEDWEDDRPGGQTGIFLKSDDKDKTHRELKSKGVEFDVELHDAPWGGGKYAIFMDLDGNKFWM